jgi:hypothetical protein
MKKVIGFSVVLIIVFLLAAISCNRDEFSIPDEATLLLQTENETIAEAVFQQIEDQIDKEIDLLETVNYLPASLKSAEADACNPVVTVDTPEKTKFPKTITLNYGSGCTDTEGNLRAGKVVVHITGPYWEKNTVRTAKLVDYLFNDLKVNGEKHEINKGTNENGYFLFDVNRSIKFTKAANGELVSDRDWKRERVYDRGKDLTKNTDDQVWVTGSAKVEKNGINMVKEITVPLYREIRCKHFMSGVITTFTNKEKTAELDYGDGKCDDQAKWTNFKTKQTKTITLKSGINWFSVKK